MSAEDVPRSCDTMVALPAATAHGQTVFAKNSDRPWNECQPLELHDRQGHETGAITRCQFVSLPEVDQTWRHVGSRPWWCWGYEHGVNEHQVVIGNEGLGSKFDSAPESRLIGMEIVRLGLERGRTARDAVDWMTRLISEFGQGKFDNDAGVRTYDNGYIVADPHQAYVIETAGHEWAVLRVESALGISNVYSVETNYESVSSTAQATAVERGWWSSDSGPFNFADAYSRGDRSDGSGAMRRKRSCTVLSAGSGGIETTSMMALLRDHSDAVNAAEPFRTDLTGKGICIHFDDGPKGGNTAASLVSDLCADGSRLPIHWCSFYSPCLAPFFPVFIEGTLPSALAIGGEHATPDSPWWRFLQLAHLIRQDAPGRIADVRACWAQLEAEWLASAYPLAARARQMIDNGDTKEAHALLSEYMKDAVEQMLNTAERLITQFSATSVAAG
jgi:secernin